MEVLDAVLVKDLLFAYLWGLKPQVQKQAMLTVPKDVDEAMIAANSVTQCFGFRSLGQSSKIPLAIVMYCIVMCALVIWLIIW